MLRIVIAAFALLLAAGPAQPSRAAEKEGATKVSKELQSIAKSNNQFAFDLYGRLGKDDGNLFFSPTSISTALAMTYAGAEGVTEKEIAGVLRFTLPEAQVHPAFASLMATLNAPKKDTYELRIANRLWGQAGYGFLPDYLATTRRQYGAELAQVDFVKEAEKSRQEINAWVEEQTNNKIKDLLPPNSVTDLTRLVLTNAIYFKGKWKYEFDKKATKDATFTVSAKEKVNVPLMFQKERFKYGEAADLQLLEMGYKGDDLSMLILLPKKFDGLPRLEHDLTAANLDKWSSGLRMQEVQTYIPRFKLTEQFQLNAMLSEMGMPSAFDPHKADFSGMNGKGDLFISAAIHKAFVEVNEEGTEAAAATGVVVGVTSAPAEPKVFRADHPFVFMIRENRTGSILFMGRVVNPEG
jgi:serpin B